MTFFIIIMVFGEVFGPFLLFGAKICKIHDIELMDNIIFRFASIGFPIFKSAIHIIQFTVPTVVLIANPSFLMTESQ